jgi:vitamin B12/bleomycin/antimicrobial peptide transport system ATP-binding/permease protein
VGFGSSALTPEVVPTAVAVGPQKAMMESLFDRLTWTRWRKAVSSFAGSPDAGRRVKVLFAALLGLLLAINGLNVVNSYVGRDFMTAIEQRSMSRFLSMALLYVGVFAASTVAAVLCRFAEESLALLWRDWLTRRLVGLYLAGATVAVLRREGRIGARLQRRVDELVANAKRIIKVNRSQPIHIERPVT